VRIPTTASQRRTKRVASSDLLIFNDLRVMLLNVNSRMYIKSLKLRHDRYKTIFPTSIFLPNYISLSKISLTTATDRRRHTAYQTCTDPRPATNATKWRSSRIAHEQRPPETTPTGVYSQAKASYFIDSCSAHTHTRARARTLPQKKTK